VPKPTKSRRFTLAALRAAAFLSTAGAPAREYGFPYDDYAGQSSDISVTNRQCMVVAVGW
jgi:hypothetical protein